MTSRTAAPPADSHVWQTLQDEARSEMGHDAFVAQFLEESVLQAASFEQALAHVLSAKLASHAVGLSQIRGLLGEALLSHPGIGRAARRDLLAVRERDPVAQSLLIPFLFFKGYQALQAYRVGHWLWNNERRLTAAMLQSRISEVFGVDIHPAARLGAGILMDHATSIVVGETSIIEDDVSILHEVTLGGTGKQAGDRHPKVRRGVLIGAGAKVLGNVEIGAGAKIGAGSVVLDPVPPHCTVAGVPARIVSRQGARMPAFEMDQQFPHNFDAGSGI